MAKVKPMEPTKAIYHSLQGDFEVIVIGSYKAFGKVYLNLEGYPNGVLSDRVTPIKEQPADPLGVISNLSVYDPEKLESNQKTFEAETSGISYVIRDEWHGQIQTGRPFDDAIEPYIRDNPDKEFRFLSTRDSVQKSRGMRGYQPVIQADGKPLQVAGMPAGWIPKEEAARRAARKIQQAEGMLSKVQSDYKEAEARAMHDGEGAFIPTKSDDATYEGKRRVG